VDSGFTRTDGAFVSGGLAYGIQMAYLIQTSAASVNPVWSWTTNSNKGTVIASFKAQPQVFLKDIYSTRGIFPKRRDIHRPVTIPFPAQQPVVGGTTFHFLPLLGTGA
jgi:hypothetical protein